jgi:3-deoxy-D-manno-octulosonic-acid transferase
MYLLYSFLLTLGVVALLPRFIYDAFRNGKYVAGLRQRTGSLAALKTHGQPVIWLHCVSVGETQAARPLARAILEQFPSHALVVSTTTLTGQQIARETFREMAAAVIYFPFDWAWTVRRALRAVNPAAVLIMETELWPRFLRECRRRSVPVAIVNGRLSERSFRRYRFIKNFVKHIVNDLELALMQSEMDAERIRALGLKAEHVKVTGNVKFDIGSDEGERSLTENLRERFHFNDGRSLIVAASTHSPEERIVLESFRVIRSTLGHEQTRLLIAPRHPERFNETASLLESSGFTWARRSDARNHSDASCDVLLLDTIGELRAVYPLADVVFVGGSIAPVGGHNILEPAAAGVCTVTGRHTSNFKAIVDAFIEADALVQLPPVTETESPVMLADVLTKLLTDDDRRLLIADNARAVLERNRGATTRTVKLLAPLLAAASDNSDLSRAEDARRGRVSA